MCPAASGEPAGRCRWAAGSAPVTGRPTLAAPWEAHVAERGRRPLGPEPWRGQWRFWPPLLLGSWRHVLCFGPLGPGAVPQDLQTPKHTEGFLGLGPGPSPVPGRPPQAARSWPGGEAWLGGALPLWSPHCPRPGPSVGGPLAGLQGWALSGLESMADRLCQGPAPRAGPRPSTPGSLWALPPSPLAGLAGEPRRAVGERGGPGREVGERGQRLLPEQKEEEKTQGQEGEEGQAEEEGR